MKSTGTDELSAAEYNEYLRTGRLPARFDNREVLMGDGVVHASIERAPVLPLNGNRYRKPYLPYQPAYGYTEWTEAQLQKEVRSQARLWGWEAYHTHDSRRSDEGFPDLCCAHPVHGICLFEFKNATREPTDKQRHWLAILRASGQHAYLVRPKDIVWVDALLQGYDHLIPEGR